MSDCHSFIKIINGNVKKYFQFAVDLDKRCECSAGAYI